MAADCPHHDPIQCPKHPACHYVKNTRGSSAATLATLLKLPPDLKVRFRKDIADLEKFLKRDE